ncbi:MAG TPA: DUF3617 family protein [Bradyrhizobium sp.]|uniref:DUF3617 domain-containing protein n=1 Tax=Bradyrhizobium sp. TaxID=376 RepID=UPI002D7FD70F|nr:DUF3617 family protein [Bradyrhizobium sp.]HET7885210.1 DUF3617 family protein [Bradyrhizobium sp.]
MTRDPAAYGLGLCLMIAAAGQHAWADDLPIRKAGLWEIKVARAGSQSPEMTMQHCTDETTDRDMNNMVSPMAKQICSKQDVTKTAAGYASDSVCSVGGVSITSHSDIVGDFNSAYTVTTTSHSDLGKGAPRDTATKIEAKWLGACKADQRPGDIVMPGGGFKIKVKDVDKLKALLPGAKQQ